MIKTNRCEYCKNLSILITYQIQSINKGLILDNVEVISYDLSKKIFNTRSYGVLNPSTAIKINQWYLYWLEGCELDKEFCSRECAISYSEHNNHYLTNSTRGPGLLPDSILPHEKIFNDFFKKHGITKKIKMGDTFLYYSDDIATILSKQDYNIEQVYQLVIKSIEKENHVDARLVTDLWTKKPYDLKKLLKAANILGFLSDYEAVNNTFEIICEFHGGTDKLSAEMLSSWAFFIHPKYSQEALSLSQMAIKKNNTSNAILGNHLAVLSTVENSLALDFIEKNRKFFKNVSEFYNAGEIYYRAEEFTKAKECFLISYEINADIAELKRLIEILFILNDYSLALLYIKKFKIVLDTFRSKIYEEGNNEKYFVFDYSYDQKQFFKKCILIIEGKIENKIGNKNLCDKMIKDAISIETSISLPQEDIYDISDYASSFISRNELESKLNQLEVVTKGLQKDLHSRQTQNIKLIELLDIIGNIQDEWGNELRELKDDIIHDSLSEYYSQKLAALTIYIQNSIQLKYDNTFESNKKAYIYLPVDCITLLSNASVLYRFFDAKFKKRTQIYSAVIIELAKSLEVGLNETLIKKFVDYLHQQNRSTIFEYTKNNHVNKIFLTDRNHKNKHVMLSDICNVLSSNQNTWLSFLDIHLPTYKSWIISILPNILDDVRLKYRNGCAHSSIATNAHAKEFFHFIEYNKLMVMLNNIARCLVSQSGNA